MNGDGLEPDLLSQLCQLVGAFKRDHDLGVHEIVKPVGIADVPDVLSPTRREKFEDPHALWIFIGVLSGAKAAARTSLRTFSGRTTLGIRITPSSIWSKRRRAP